MEMLNKKNSAPKAVKKPVLNESASKKPVAKKLTKVTPEQRMKMIEEAAYYRAEKAGFAVDPHSNWVAAEAEIDAMLGLKKSK
jgi:hypothetical protein